jgi:hypothetical protein
MPEIDTRGIRRAALLRTLQSLGGLAVIAFILWLLSYVVVSIGAGASESLSWLPSIVRSTLFVTAFALAAPGLAISFSIDWFLRWVVDPGLGPIRISSLAAALTLAVGLWVGRESARSVSAQSLSGSRAKAEGAAGDLGDLENASRAYVDGFSEGISASDRSQKVRAEVFMRTMNDWAGIAFVIFIVTLGIAQWLTNTD